MPQLPSLGSPNPTSLPGMPPEGLSKPLEGAVRGAGDWLRNFRLPSVLNLSKATPGASTVTPGSASGSASGSAASPPGPRVDKLASKPSMNFPVSREKIEQIKPDSAMGNRTFSQKLMTAPQDYLAEASFNTRLASQGLKQSTARMAGKPLAVEHEEAKQAYESQVQGMTMGAVGEIGAVGRGAAKNLGKKVTEEAAEAALFKGKKPAEGWVKSLGEKSAPAMPKNVIPATPPIPPFSNFKDLSTKILGKLEGKTLVSKQFISDLTNSGDVKQVERDIFRNVLDSMKGEKVNVKELADKVQSELLPLKLNKATKTKNASFVTSYEHVALPSDTRGAVKNYAEHVYESPIKTSAGDIHFGKSFERPIENYFGHTRVEDMADNKTRRVIEVQSDLFQRKGMEQTMSEESGNWEDQFNRIAKKEHPGKDISKLSKEENKIIADKTNKDFSKLQQYNDPTAHFRMIREEVKKAAEDGKTKLQFPTGETSMKVEGLGDNSRWAELDSGDALSKENLKVGQEIVQGEFESGSWVITEVLGDGKFKAVPKDTHERFITEAAGNLQEAKSRSLRFSESFDISGKVDTSNPIYKFYDKDVGKYLRGKYNAQLVTDKQGATWWEVNIGKEHKGPVEAFGVLPLAALGLEDQQDKQEQQYRLPSVMNLR